MKNSSSRVMAAAVTITSFLILCSGVASGTTVTVTVGTGGFFFTPSSVTIHPGDTVKWTWSSTGHSSTSGTPGHPSGLWDSGVLAQGALFTHTFNTVGSFPYYCTPHGACCNMVGTVTVSNATPTPTPPPPPPGPGTAIVADFNGDGHQDFVVRNPATRQSAIWYLNNNVFINGVFGPSLPAGWGLSGAWAFFSDCNPESGLFPLAMCRSVTWHCAAATFIRAALGATSRSAWGLVAS